MNETLPQRCYDPQGKAVLKHQIDALAVSEAKYRNLFESMSDAMVRVDMEGRFQEFNEAYLRMLGYERDELLRLRYEDITLQKWHTIQAGIIAEQIVPNGSSEVFEKEYRRKDGSVFPVEVRAFLIRDEKGKPSMMWGIVRDITARKRNENREHWRTQILEAITTGASLPSVLDLLVLSIESEDPALLCSVLLLDDEGKHLIHGSAPHLPDFFNDAIDGAAIGEGFGSCGAAAYTGKRVIVEDILTHPYWVNYRELAQKAGLRSCWSEPIFCTKGNVIGTFAIYHRTPECPDEEQIKLIAYAAALASIAIERKKAEEALVRAKAAAEASSEAKSRFLALLSHEFRTPLNPAMMLIYEWQKNPMFPKKLRPDLMELRQSIETEIALINDLLDVTAIDHIKMQLILQLHDVDELLNSITHTVQSGHQKKDVQFITDFQAKQTLVRTDSTRLEKVLWNLIRNALKFTPKGGRVTVSTRNEDHKLRIDITDTGVGIRPQMIPRIFEAFEQGDHGNSREYGGLGLGLAIARGMVEAMGGTLSVKSQGEGCGSTFSVLLDTAG